MIQTERFSRNVKRLYSLVRFQKGLRLALRAAWLGLGGMILAWGVNEIWGLLPHPLYWLAAGVVFAAPALVSIVIASPNDRNWAWRLDRRLELKEQVSTAWEAAESTQQNEVAALLVQDMNRLLPRIYTRVRKRGWYLEADLLSALIVALLGGLVILSMVLRPQSNLVGSPPPAFGPLPALPEPMQPFAQEEQPGGQPETEPQAGNEPGGDTPSQGQPESGDQPGSKTESGQVEEALRELGSDLSRQAGTYDLGRALENLDLNAGADALEDLGSQLDELSPESRENLREALDKAAGSLDAAGESELSNAMENAARSLEDQAGEEAQSLDELADALRNLDQNPEAGQAGQDPGGGDGSGGEANRSEPLSRLPGESGDLSLPLENPTGSALLSPGNLGDSGDNPAMGTLEGTGSPQTGNANSPLVPGSLMWKWRDVVSRYFQR